MTRSEAFTHRILIADDQRDVLKALQLLLKSNGYKADSVTSPRELLQNIKSTEYDLVLMDLNYTRDTTSGEEGLELLSRIGEIDPTVPIVVMTAWGSIELAVRAMRSGARDFIQKPWDNARLLTILKTQIELRQALKNGERLQEANRILQGDCKEKIIAESDAMKPVMDLIMRIGPSEANILLTGENGTGKNLIAQLLHSLSSRSDKPLITVNISELSPGIIESELFGHVKGAFTDARQDRAGRFELADGGTLFMDEVANIPYAQQTKLLRFMETGEFERVGSSRTCTANVRIISATNSDLHSEVAEGRFRRDLYFRLNTVEIHLPPLRDRQSDIPLLARFFLKNHTLRYRKDISDFTDNALNILKNHSWPGNIRELDHVVERAVLMSTGTAVNQSDLGLKSDLLDTRNLDEMDLEEVEKVLIRKSLVRHNGNVSKAAKALGLSRSGLYRRLSKHGM
ncbi:sigma-54-dependent Fis family transcriptional regulator [bacterium]|nr:sigma-54-dependent Fis family transcriptional regulator [candidate division CSSED10-310 bacterium]